jgi:hypothetical protein
MAKKTNSTSSGSNYSLVKLCAFVGIILTAVAGLISFILNVLGKCGITISWGTKISGICTLVSLIALYITVWLAAYDYVKTKSKTWKIIYFVLLLLCILGLFGFSLGSLFA